MTDQTYGPARTMVDAAMRATDAERAAYGGWLDGTHTEQEVIVARQAMVDVCAAADALDARSAGPLTNTVSAPGPENEHVREYLAGYAVRWPQGDEAAEQLARAWFEQIESRLEPQRSSPLTAMHALAIQKSECLRMPPPYLRACGPGRRGILMLDSSREIIERAIAEYQPYTIVAMISGGKDSLCAYLVAKQLDAPITHILHGMTGTGIPETTEFVRDFAAGESPTYIESNAGNAYEDYVRRKGFFGRGLKAHSYAYHILKHQRFTATLSRHIRQRRRNRNILLLNGARASESANRAANMPTPYRVDGSNIWINICHEWSKEQRDGYLASVDAPVNPVTQKLCRSGECMCGTMQSKADREEASFYFPAWGAWLDALETDVRRNFDWGWGMATPAGVAQEKAGQLAMFQPMCVGCITDAGRIAAESAPRGHPEPQP